MAQTVQLAIGTTTAPSSDIVIAAGATAVVGIYADTGSKLDGTALAYLYQKTPGAPNLLEVLDSTNPSVEVKGANTVYVQRVLAGAAFGVFSE